MDLPRAADVLGLRESKYLNYINLPFMSDGRWLFSQREERRMMTADIKGGIMNIDGIILEPLEIRQLLHFTNLPHDPRLGSFSPLQYGLDAHRLGETHGSASY